MIWDIRPWCFITLLASQVAPMQTAKAAELAKVFIDNGELNYVGAISEEANRQVATLFASAQKKPAILSIRSKGGPTQDGIELGRWVRANEMTVKVMEYCFSSCANYVFTAAPRKVVSNFAVVGYHGGLSSSTFALDDKQEAMLNAMPAEQRLLVRKKIEQSILQEIAPQVEAERLFFSLIGVQQRITTLGQVLNDRPEVNNDKSIGWTYSIEDFSKLGVHHIRVINPPWKPTFVNTDKTVTLLKVD